MMLGVRLSKGWVAFLIGVMVMLTSCGGRQPSPEPLPPPTPPVPTPSPAPSTNYISIEKVIVTGIVDTEESFDVSTYED